MTSQREMEGERERRKRESERYGHIYERVIHH